MNLDPKRLAVLGAVVRSGSMTAAARELQYSTAAVSQHVAALERQVGAPLLVRHARGVRPTAAGALLARHASGLAERIDLARRELAELLDSDGGTVRLGIFASAAVGALPAAFAWFRARHPRVEVVVAEHDALPAVDALRDGELDVAVVLDPTDAPELDRSSLELTPLGLDRLDVLLSVSHRLAGEREVALADLRGESWILPGGPTCAGVVERSCRAAGFEPRVALTTDDYAAARSLAASGMGVTAVPRLLRQQDDAEVVVRPLSPAPAHQVLVATRDDGSGPPAALRLRDAFVATARL